VLECRIDYDVMPVTPAEKFKEELTKLVKYWEVEFDMEHWTIAGVMFDLAVDVLFGSHTLSEEDEEYEDTE